MSRARKTLTWTLTVVLLLVLVAMVAVLYGLRPESGCENDQDVSRMLLTWLAATALGAVIAVPLFVVAAVGPIPARTWRYGLALVFALGIAVIITVVGAIVIRTDPTCYV